MSEYLTTLKKFPNNINYIGLVEPMEICARLDIPYFVSKHNSSEPYAVHYTRGGPWFTEWQDVEYAENWNKEKEKYLKNKFNF